MFDINEIMQQFESERKQIGLSVWALCTAARVHENSYRSYLDGTGNPTIKTLARIDNALRESAENQSPR